MALTISICQSGESSHRENDDLGDRESLSLHFDTDVARVVIGRGEGCDVRLPDLSVSHRHATLRRKGHDFILVDEGSTNGTFVGKVRLGAQAGVPVRSGSVLRFGRVAVAITLDALPHVSATPADAIEIALELVLRGLREAGEDGRPRIVSVRGSESSVAFIVAQPRHRYVIGRGRDADLCLMDPGIARHHIDVMRKGDHLCVQRLGAEGPLALNGEQSDAGQLTWRDGDRLTIGRHELQLEFPAVEALAEIERSPELEIALVHERDDPDDAALSDHDATASRDDHGERQRERLQMASSRAADHSEAAPSRRIELLVVALSIGVLIASGLGLAWILRR